MLQRFVVLEYELKHTAMPAFGIVARREAIDFDDASQRVGPAQGFFRPVLEFGQRVG